MFVDLLIDRIHQVRIFTINWCSVPLKILYVYTPGSVNPDSGSLASDCCKIKQSNKPQSLRDGDEQIIKILPSFHQGSSISVFKSKQ